VREERGNGQGNKPIQTQTRAQEDTPCANAKRDFGKSGIRATTDKGDKREPLADGEHRFEGYSHLEDDARKRHKGTKPKNPRDASEQAPPDVREEEKVKTDIVSTWTTL